MLLRHPAVSEVAIVGLADERWGEAPYAGALPIKALAQVLEDAYTPAAHAFPAADLAILLAWAVAGETLASLRLIGVGFPQNLRDLRHFMVRSAPVCDGCDWCVLWDLGAATRISPPAPLTFPP